MSSSYSFFIIGKRDNPLYEYSSSQKKEDFNALQQNQFFVHAALDIVDEELWKTNSMYLKTVDKFNDKFISAYVTAGHVKFMLIHDGKGEESLKNFFSEVHELYLKVAANPLCDLNAQITSTAFDTRVRAVARKYL